MNKNAWDCKPAADVRRVTSASIARSVQRPIEAIARHAKVHVSRDFGLDLQKQIGGLAQNRPLLVRQLQVALAIFRIQRRS